MTRQHHEQAGFSAIELLITLFIAAAFIAAGYQLYTIIIKNGGEARQETTANNAAYDLLRRYASDVPPKCIEKTVTPAPAIPNGSGLPAGAAASVAYSCPYGNSSTISKVIVKITYGTPQKEMTHAIFASRY